MKVSLFGLLLALAVLSIVGASAVAAAAKAGRIEASGGGEAENEFALGVEVRESDLSARLELVRRDGTVIKSWDTGWDVARIGWSPDGTKIAWVTRAGLYVAQSDGSRRRLLVPHSTTCPLMSTTNCEQELTFAWSPDGEMLLVGGTGQLTNGIRLVSVTTGRGREVAPLLALTNYGAIGWLPDGRSFLYTRLIGRNDPAHCCSYDVRVESISGGAARIAYRFSGCYPIWGAEPVLSPDRHWIAFAGGERCGGIGTADLRSGKTSTTIAPYDPSTPVWSPDSKRIAFTGFTRTEIAETVPLEDGHPTKIAEGTAVGWTPAEGLLLKRGPNDNEIWAAAANRTARRLFELPRTTKILVVAPR